MYVIQKGQERTIGTHVEVAKAAGWKIVHLYLPPDSIFHHIVAEAV